MGISLLEVTFLFYISGQMAGPSTREEGSGSNYLCMPHQPFYAFASNRLKLRAHLYGVEYGQVDDIFLRIPGRPTDMNYHGVPCAVCRTLSRPSLIMVPARFVCPSNAWTREYHGYLMSSSNNSSRAEYICVDADAGVAKQTGNERTRRESLLTGVRGKCGTLPCPRYKQDRDLTCAVCTA
ncbi:uncharacterized protein LOC116297389 [Actinia tenebrosa]|uniref:Uncharacterized protein LOC116297389 n=1 Tax=Actinia tenebrosa TaxID=6105 RepID=A0A6P8I1Q7_ACTTE|nr:uncharacterized protein LOC116297389 [Actinia tenebrosa]